MKNLNMKAMGGDTQPAGAQKGTEVEALAPPQVRTAESIVGRLSTMVIVIMRRLKLGLPRLAERSATVANVWRKGNPIRSRKRAFRSSVLFNRDWYLSQYPDVAAAGVDPLEHYYSVGGREGRDPTPLFDSDWYLKQNQDVAAAGINPFEHYYTAGGREGRDPNLLFDSDWYLAHNPDVAAAGVNPLEHYCSVGAWEGRDPNPLFDSDWYLAQNPDVAASGANPLEHYCTIGAKNGRDPNPGFQSAWYLAMNPDVAAQQMNPLAHFLRFGVWQGRPFHEVQRQLRSIADYERTLPVLSALAQLAAGQE